MGSILKYLVSQRTYQRKSTLDRIGKFVPEELHPELFHDRPDLLLKLKIEVATELGFLDIEEVEENFRIGLLKNLKQVGVKFFETPEVCFHQIDERLIVDFVTLANLLVVDSDLVEAEVLHTRQRLFDHGPIVILYSEHVVALAYQIAVLESRV